MAIEDASTIKNNIAAKPPQPSEIMAFKGYRHCSQAKDTIDSRCWTWRSER